MTLLPLLLGLAPLAPSDEAIRLERTFQVGEQDRYAVQFQIVTYLGETSVNLDLAFKVQQTVKKRLEGGDALILSEIKDYSSAIDGGRSTPDPSRHEAAEFRLDSRGMPQAAGPKSPLVLRMVHYVGLLGFQPLKLGQPIEMENPKSSPDRVTGRVALVSQEASEVKLSSNWRIETPAQNPIQIDMTSFIDPACGKLLRASGTIQTKANDVPLQAIQFSVKRENK